MELPVMPDAPATAAFARVARALSDPLRLTMLQLIARGLECCDSACCPPVPAEVAERDGVCTCEFVSLLKVPQSLVSYHMKALKEAGLVEETGVGKWTLYSLNRSAFRGALSGIAQFVLNKEGSCCE